MHPLKPSSCRKELCVHEALNRNKWAIRATLTPTAPHPDARALKEEVAWFLLRVLFNIKILCFLMVKKVGSHKKIRTPGGMAWMLMKTSTYNIVFPDNIIGKSDKSSHSTWQFKLEWPLCLKYTPANSLLSPFLTAKLERQPVLPVNGYFTRNLFIKFRSNILPSNFCSLVLVSYQENCTWPFFLCEFFSFIGRDLSSVCQNLLLPWLISSHVYKYP